MKTRMTAEAERVMSLAQREARQLDHEYVGTEHVLLALLIERPAAMGAIGVTPEDIRREIEKLVHRGPSNAMASSPPAELPLTPRAKRVVAHAHLEASSHSQSGVEPEHLLVGLIHEPDGVAGQVMRKLGLDLAHVRRESLKLRLAQMRIVERAVRPVRAGTKCKRKMREELLAHLAGIFEDERSRQSDPNAALAEAARRFGDPAQLARELERALPYAERRNYHVERWFGWRAPESVASMMFRTSLLTFGLVVALICVPMLAGMAIQGWKPEDAVAWRTLAGMALALPVAQFLIGVCYYKIRDSLWGVFGAKKSVLNGLARAALLALCVGACSAGLIAMMNAGVAVVLAFVPQLVVTSIFTAVVCTVLAFVRGPIEIRDTTWACLDLETAE